MKVFLAALLFIGLGVLGMCFNIIFRKNGHFPQYDVGSNENMRKMGIRCMKEEEDEIWGDKKSKRKAPGCTGEFSDACGGCALYELERGKLKNEKK